MSRTSPYEEGLPGSSIALVGEAPSRQEMRQGRPFVGPAGMVLDECLHTAGLIRRQCYITNVITEECFRKKASQNLYRRSDGAVIWNAKSGFTEEGMPYVHALKERLDRCKANVFVALGGPALDALTSLSGILKWRGSILESDVLDGGRKVIPTIHPSAVLQGQHIWKYLIIFDLRRVRQEAGSAALRLPERDLITDPSHAECMDFLASLENKPRVAFDTEIYNGHISCISFCSDPKVAISIPFLDRYRQPNWSVHQEDELWCAIARLLSNPTSLKINQNILFDMFMLLYRMGIHTKGPVADTMVAFNLMYVDFKKGLDIITSIYTREPYYKDEGKTWRNPFRDMTSFWRYNAKDAACALESWLAMEPELRSGGYRQTHDRTVGMYDALLFMMVRGLRVDKLLLQAARDKLKIDLQGKTDELKVRADYAFNPLSPKQCQQYFYIHKGARPYISPKTGQVTTDDLALARLWRRHHWPEIKLVQDIRTLKKLGSAYYDVELDGDDRLRGSYNPRGTWTGRLSSSETVFGTGLNLQNLDPSFKAFIIPDEERENEDHEIRPDA